MSPRPGVDIFITEPSPLGGGVLDTGQAFMLGVAQRGPTEQPIRLRSLRVYESNFGTRTGGPVLHDSVRAYFQEGGSVLQVLRVVGTDADSAEGSIGASDLLEITARSPGAWGNSLKVAIQADTGVSTGRRVVVTLDGTVVESSPLILTAGDAVDWSNTSSTYVRLTTENPETTLATAAAVTLTGGSDDNQIDAADVQAALKNLPYALGPGQIVAPGYTNAAIHAAILEHCDENRRVALLDLNDQDKATLAADVVGLYGLTGRWGQAVAPRLQYPGPASSTSVLIPYSGVQAGIIARQDQATGNPNAPAAGVDGISRNARALALEFTDDDREELNELGVTLAKVRFDTVRTYGSRTCAGPGQPNWRWFGGSRVVMAISHEADSVAEQFVHKQIDGQGRIFLELKSSLTAICDRYWNLGALYGETADEAYLVDTSDAVNTPQTIDNGEIHAVIQLRTSPSAEWVVIEISKTPVTMALAA